MSRCFAVAILLIKIIFLATEVRATLPDFDPTSVGYMDNSRMNKVVDRLYKIYEQEFSKKGLSLEFNRRWDINADIFDYKEEQRKAIITLWAGKNKRIVSMFSEDAFASLVCHEIGHGLGGTPRFVYKGAKIPFEVTGEDQADYFAAAKCLKRYFLDDDNVRIIQNIDIPKSLKNDCENAYKNANETAICIRTIYAIYRNRVAFSDIESPAPSLISRAEESSFTRPAVFHPSSQCRMDFGIAGALCPIEPTVPFDNTDPNIGACTETYYPQGSRPKCW